MAVEKSTSRAADRGIHPAIAQAASPAKTMAELSPVRVATGQNGASAAVGRERRVR